MRNLRCRLLRRKRCVAHLNLVSLLIGSQHLLPHCDIVVGRGVEETARFTVSASSKSLFAWLVADTDGALNSSCGATPCLVLGLANEPLAQSMAFMVLAHGQVADFPLVPLNLLYLDARDNDVAAELEQVILGVPCYLFGR